MLKHIQNLVFESYITWLKDKTIFREINNFVEITTPFLDRHNDYIQIYVKIEGDKYLITDDGYTIEDLSQSGCDLISPKRKSLLTTALQGFGVQKEPDTNAIFVYANKTNFAWKKHNIIQSLLAINDLFYTANPIVFSLFYETVSTWLDSNDIRYTPRVKFTGKTGFDHLFDFVIPKSKVAPERIVKAVSRPNRDSAENFAFSWIDTKEVRNIDTIPYAVLNDSEDHASASVIEAFQNYDIKPILWSERQKYQQELYA